MFCEVAIMRAYKIVSFSVVLLLITVLFAGVAGVVKGTYPLLSFFFFPTSAVRGNRRNAINL
jgi:hypothetical protein